MCARTLRSSRWRTANELKVLHNLTRRIIAIQLQGHIFFGNATILAAEVERMIRLSIASRDVCFIVLDFTLVVGIDSSAAETILSIFKYCKKNRIRLCYSSGSSTGFPCVFPLSSRINALDHEEISVLFNHCTHCGASSSLSSSSSSSSSCSISLHECISCGMKNRINRKKWVYHSPNLDDALAWCEDIIIIEHRNKIKSVGVHGHSVGVTNTDNNNNGLSQLKESLSLPNIAMNIPTYLHQIYIMASNESPDRIDRLLSYFVRDSIEQGTVLWMQGTLSDRAVLVISGRLEHLLEEEADTRELVYPGDYMSID